jgi:hypothetical protein
MTQFLQRTFLIRGFDQAAPPIWCQSLSGSLLSAFH